MPKIEFSYDELHQLEQAVNISLEKCKHMRVRNMAKRIQQFSGRENLSEPDRVQEDILLHRIAQYGRQIGAYMDLLRKIRAEQ